MGVESWQRWTPNPSLFSIQLLCPGLSTLCFCESLVCPLPPPLPPSRFPFFLYPFSLSPLRTISLFPPFSSFPFLIPFPPFPFPLAPSFPFPLSPSFLSPISPMRFSLHFCSNHMAQEPKSFASHQATKTHRTHCRPNYCRIDYLRGYLHGGIPCCNFDGLFFPSEHWNLYL